MKYLLRFVANSIALYLALYLVDSVAHHGFWIKSWWIAVILAVLLGALNSLIRPLHRTRPQRALTVALATLVMNALVLQIFVWIHAPLSTTSIIWVLAVAAFVSVLGGVLNWLIGFKKKERPGVITRERRDSARQAGTPRKRD